MQPWYRWVLVAIHGVMVLGQHGIRARFLSLARNKLRLCSANHRAGYFSNLACDWLSIAWAYRKRLVAWRCQAIAWPVAMQTHNHWGSMALIWQQLHKISVIQIWFRFTHSNIDTSLPRANDVNNRQATVSSKIDLSGYFTLHDRW